MVYPKECVRANGSVVENIIIEKNISYSQGICSAYDIIMVCRLDLLSVIGVRGHGKKNGNGKSKVSFDKERKSMLIWIYNIPVAANQYLFIATCFMSDMTQLSLRILDWANRLTKFFCFLLICI